MTPKEIAEDMSKTTNNAVWFGDEVRPLAEAYLDLLSRMEGLEK